MMAACSLSAYSCEACGLYTVELDVLLQHDCPAGSLGQPSQDTNSQVDYSPHNPSPSAASQDCSPFPSTAAVEVETKLDKWADRHTKLLISTYKEIYSKQDRKGKLTKKAVFEIIAKAFNQKSREKVTGYQCLRKWQKLEDSYKKVADHNNQTGRDRKEWKFMDEMNDCIGSSPKVSPTLVIESSSFNISRSSSSSTNYIDDDDEEEDEEDDEDEEKIKKKKKCVKRKRKSHSSAAEMLQFLENYTDRKEKVEKEKLELMKEMKEEKSKFYSQFLDVMKKH